MDSPGRTVGEAIKNSAEKVAVTVKEAASTVKSALTGSDSPPVLESGQKAAEFYAEQASQKFNCNILSFMTTKMSAPVADDVDKTFADSVKKSRDAAKSGEAPEAQDYGVVDAVRNAANTTIDGLYQGAHMIKETIVGGEKTPVEAKEDAKKGNN